MVAFTLCTLRLLQRGGRVGADSSSKTQREAGVGITEKARGPQGHKPWSPCPSLVENIQDGNSLFDFSFLFFFFWVGEGVAYHLCFFLYSRHK